jgi:hypothetical protein
MRTSTSGSIRPTVNRGTSIFLDHQPLTAYTSNQLNGFMGISSWPYVPLDHQPVVSWSSSFREPWNEAKATPSKASSRSHSYSKVSSMAASAIGPGTSHSKVSGIKGTSSTARSTLASAVLQTGGSVNHPHGISARLPSALRPLPTGTESHGHKAGVSHGMTESRRWTWGKIYLSSRFPAAPITSWWAIPGRPRYRRSATNTRARPRTSRRAVNSVL